MVEKSGAISLYMADDLMAMMMPHRHGGGGLPPPQSAKTYSTKRLTGYDMIRLYEWGISCLMMHKGPETGRSGTKGRAGWRAGWLAGWRAGVAMLASVRYGTVT